MLFPSPMPIPSQLARGDDALALALFYDQIGGDLADVRKRLVTDERIDKFVRIFLSDETYAALEHAFENGLSEPAFRAAHTLKGVGRDLGFTALSQCASDLTEALRADEAGVYGNMEEAAELYARVRAAYADIVAAMPLLDA